MEIMTKADGLVFAVVFCAMVLDFISGTVVAVIRHEWKSKIMREGLLHKCSLLLCVVLGIEDGVPTGTLYATEVTETTSAT